MMLTWRAAAAEEKACGPASAGQATGCVSGLAAQPASANGTSPPAFDARSKQTDRGDKSGSIAGFTEVLRSDPKNIRALLSRGTVYREKGDLDSAVADFNLAITIDPSNVDAYIARGAAYRDRGDLNRAIADYKLVIMLDPGNAQAYTDRGITYRQKGDLERAIADYDKAIALQPGSAAPYFERGGCYYEKGDVDHAIADYSLAIKADPNFAGAYMRRGLRYADKNDLDNAIVDFSRAIAIDPGNADAFSHRCWARLVAGRQLPEARSDCNRSLHIRPNDAGTFNDSGLIDLKTEKPDDAIANFSAAIKNDARLAGAIYSRGLAKLKKGDVAGGDQDMTAARAMDPGVAQELARYGIK